MLRLRLLSWLVICTATISLIVPAFPAYAASPAAVTSPILQDDIVNHIADIRSEDPDIEEDFSTDSGVFETTYDGTTSSYFKSGELRIDVDDENTLAWSSLSQPVGDFYVEVDTIQHEGSLDNQYGILTRLDEDGNYYLFAASSDGYYTIQTHLDGDWEPLVEWTESDEVNTGEGETNTLALLAEGDTYTFLINDTIVETVSDDTLTGSTLALNAAAFGEPPVDMGFDNFRLWSIGEPLEIATRQPPVDGRDNSGTPEPSDTPEPTEEATQEATKEATEEATVEPTEQATEEATVEPTQETNGGTSSDPQIASIQAQIATFIDNFEDGDLEGWTPLENDAVEYDASGGTLDFVYSAPNILTWAQLPTDTSHYYLEADATVNSTVETAEYGIIFNYIDNQNFYLFAINNAGSYSVWQLVDNSWSTVQDWADSDVLQSGEGNTNRLGLLVDGTHVVLAANDEVLTEFDNSEEASGGVALAGGTFDEPDLTMSYDNVMLWDLDQTEVEPTSEPTDKVEPTDEVEPTEVPTEEATVEPTEEAQDFSEVTDRIAEITANPADISDDFRRDNGLWDVTTDDFGSSYYQDRAFNIEAFAEDRIVWASTYEEPDTDNPMQFDDFYAEFDTTFVTYTGENAAGIVFRLVDSDNFYKFLVDESGYFQLQKRVDGEYTDVIEWALSDQEDDSEGAVNRIGVLAEGSTIAFTLNGTVIAQTEDSDLASGAIALTIQSYSTPEAHSTFDNLKIWQLNQ